MRPYLEDVLFLKIWALCVVKIVIQVRYPVKWLWAAVDYFMRLEIFEAHEIGLHIAWIVALAREVILDLNLN